MFSSLEAISFKDIDDYALKSGYTDIIVIADFVAGAGQDGAKPLSDDFIFKNDSWGNFIEDRALEKRIRGSTDTRTLTMKQVFELAKPFDIKRFAGKFTESSSNEYDGSKITINRIDKEKMEFSVDAFHVNGGAEGIKTGNVNVGSIENGVATVQGYAAAYKAADSDFRMTFEFFGNGAFAVTEQGTRPFGANVYASGIYKRDK